MAERKNKTNGSSGGRADKKELAVNQLEPVSCAAPKITEIIIIMTRTTATATARRTATRRRIATWPASANESNCEYTHVNVNVDYNFACLLTTFLLRRVCVYVLVLVCVCSSLSRLGSAGSMGPSILTRPSSERIPAQSRFCRFPRFAGREFN